MGVPKFFRYISERYPCLSELVVDHNIPDFDNLYLDMNGIIHNCSHPNDTNVHFRISEEQIFKDIFSYIEFLFLIIKPKKLFFLAVDGVAPRAKMNQQRGRRFRSAKDAEELEEKARKSGDVLPEGDRFDSNCITPGTEFMDRLQKALEYFIQSKITASPIWQQCRVILSGHQTPGEGEHKIMEYVRYLKVQTDYDPDTRHCLYGLDADLIMLGLCSHERYFSLLREEVKFGKTAARVTSVNETKFFLLHLCLMREYLELEFTAIKNSLKFPFDLEKIIDDWIFMGFLVGNDFIPHLPNLHINNNALPLLYTTYMKVLPSLDGYINEEGTLNLERFEKFMEALAEHDRESFRQQYSDLEYFESKKTRNNDAFEASVDDIKASNGFEDDLDALVKNTEEMFRDDLDDVLPMGDMEDGEFFEQEFQQFKKNYYIEKLGFQEITDAIRSELAEEYVRALQWTLSYYYCGVQSWGWFYPHHYSPFISDIQHFKSMSFNLSLGKPFLPFQQLLSVLPAASRKSIPVAYHDLMTSPASKIIDFYPTNFLTDLNGKKQEWEAVVLIPFMEEVRLLEAMTDCTSNLTPYEKERNSHGPMFQYDYCSKGRGMIDGVANFPSISNVLCTETKVMRDEVFVPSDKIVFGPSQKGASSVYYPGFPTLKHLKYRAELKMKQVKVFDQPSRSDNMIIKLNEEVNADKEMPAPDFLKKVAEELLDKTVHIHWPHLAEAKVVEVFDAVQKITKKKVENREILVEDINPRMFQLAFGSVKEHHMNRLGIDLGEIQHMVNVLPCIGHQYVYANHKYQLEKIYSTFKVAYPLKATVKNLKAYDGNFEPSVETDKMFSVGTTVFMLAPQYYGSMGVVTDTSMLRKTQRIKVSLCVPPEPSFSRAIEQKKNCKPYYNGYNAASMLGISSNVLSRITGTVLVVQGQKLRQVPEGTTKFNVGLQMRFVKNNEEVVGYTRKTNQSWQYSEEALAIIRNYADKYPQIFKLVSQLNNGLGDTLFESDVFPMEMGQGKVNEMVKWVKSQPHANADRRNCGTELLGKEVIEELIVAVEANKNNPLRQIILQVKPHLLYKVNMSVSNTGPDPKADFDLFDRITVASDSLSVPLGYKGTIIGIQKMVDLNPVRQERVKQEYVSYEILCDEEFAEGSQIYGIAQNRIAKIRETNLINISYGQSLSDENTNNKKPVEKSAWQANKSVVDVMKNKNQSQTMALLQGLQIKPAPVAQTTEPVIAEKPEIPAVLNNTNSAVSGEEEQKAKAETIWKELMNPKPNLPPIPLAEITKIAPPPKILQKERAPPVAPVVNAETNTLKMMLGIGKPGAANLPQPPKTWCSTGPKAEAKKAEEMPRENFGLPMNPNLPRAPPANAMPRPPLSFQPPFPSFPMQPAGFSANPRPIIYQPQPFTQNQGMNYFSALPAMGPQPMGPQPMGPPSMGPPSMGPPFTFSSYQPPKNNNTQQPGPTRPNFQNAYPNRQQRQEPNGPQQLNFDNAHSSAFVPLQAQRKALNKSAKKQNPQPQQQPAVPNKFETHNASQRATNEAKQEEFKNNFALFLENMEKSKVTSNVIDGTAQPKETAVNAEPVTIEKKKAVFADKKPPKSRLAAKFLSTDS